MQNQDCTDEVTEDDDEIPQRQFRKSLKQSINNSNNYRQPNNSWLSRDHDNYHLIRSQQMYNYPKKYDIKQTTLDPNLMEYYSKKRPCRYCGGTGSDLIEPAITRKINCRVHDSAKVNFNTKEKFGIFFFILQLIILNILFLKSNYFLNVIFNSSKYFYFYLIKIKFEFESHKYK